MTRHTLRTRALMAGTATAALLAFAAPAWAQTAPSADPTSSLDTATVEDVVVTASRVTRAGYEAPTPTTVLGEEQIDQAAPANIADFVNDLPQLSPSSTPTTNNGSIGGGAQGANFLNLRGLGANRTLTLLDGHRVVGSALTGSVDVNLLPAALIKRVEVVTGGASAAWGSDAVAGVVNFVLDRTFTGLKVEAQTGVAQEGDVENSKVEISYGTPFAADRGHLLVSGLLSDDGGSERARSRGWYQGYQIIQNPAFVAGGTAPRTILARNVGSGSGTPGGLISAGPLRGIQFGPGGVLQTYDFGYLVGTQQIGGTFIDSQGGTVLQSPVEQKSLYARASYDLTDAITAYAEASYGRTQSEFDSLFNSRTGNITIRNDNAFMSADLRSRMAAAGITSFLMSRRNDDVGTVRTDNTRELSRGVLGVDAQLSDNWSTSAYVQYGVSKVVNAVENDLVLANYTAAIDSIIDPATSAPVCRSRVAGCVPFNPFGLGSPSAEAMDYVTGTALQHIELKQQVAAWSVQGEPFSIWAGPVSFAGGLEYRKEELESDADPISLINGFHLGNYKASLGEYDVKEGFAEVVAPLFRDLPIGKALDLNGAVRYTDYSTSGGVTTWKLGATYDANDEVRIRATRSRDIRAPNLSDLFLGGQTNSGPLTDPLNPATGRNIRIVTSGNTALTPEISATTTAGIVYRPSWLQGFTTSIDWYRIEVEDAITIVSAQNVVTQCLAGATLLCGQVTRDGAGQLVEVRQIPVNAQSHLVSGVDIEASYSTDLEALNLPGRLMLRAVAAQTRDFAITTNGVVDDNLGEISQSGPPKWRFYASATYSQDRGSVTFSGHGIDGGVYDNTNTPATIDINDIDGRTYYDLSGTWNVRDKQVQVFGVVENLFNTDPAPSPIPGAGGAVSPGVATQYFDPIGRQFRVGVRLRF